MLYLSFISSGGRRIQFVDEPNDVTDDADFYILWKDRFVFHEQAKKHMRFRPEKIVDEEVAERLIEQQLLWPAEVPF